MQKVTLRFCDYSIEIFTGDAEKIADLTQKVNHELEKVRSGNQNTTIANLALITCLNMQDKIDELERKTELMQNDLINQNEAKKEIKRQSEEIKSMKQIIKKMTKFINEFSEKFESALT